jgi:hypothetical protein
VLLGASTPVAKLLVVTTSEKIMEQHIGSTTMIIPNSVAIADILLVFFVLVF